MTEFELGKVFDFSPLKPDVVNHLSNIYSLLAVGIVATGLGSLFDIYVYQVSGITTMILAGLAFSYAATSNRQLRDGDNIPSHKLAAYIGFTFLKGMSFAQLFNFATFIDPTILPTAFFASISVFICFSTAAVCASRRDLMFITAAGSSLLLFTLFTSLASLIFSHSFLVSINLYAGLFTFICYVVIDTQKIILNYKSGDRDIVAAASQLYYDIFAIFVRLVLILLRSREDQKKRR